MTFRPKAPIKIQAFTAADYSDWLGLWKAYLTFYESVLSDEVSRVSFSRMLDLKEPTFGVFAMSGDQAVGIVHWIYHRSNWTVGNYCYLQDLYVAEGNRGKGIGRALIEHVYTEAGNAGCSRVYWLTHESNAKARLLYDKIAERSGFIHYKKML